MGQDARFRRAVQAGRRFSVKIGLMRTPRRIALVGAVLLAIFLLPAAVTFYTDWLWFGETGYQAGLRRRRSRRRARSAAWPRWRWPSASCWSTCGSRCATLSPRELVIDTREGPIVHRHRSPPRAAGRPRRSPAVAGAAVRRCARRASGRSGCCSGTRSRSATRDPDARQGRRLLRLPAAVPGGAAAAICSALVALAVVTAGAVYVIAGAVELRSRAAGCASRGRRRRHLAVLAAALLLVLAFGAYLDVPRLLTTPAGIIHGAANVDVAVRIPALRVLMVAALVGAGAGAVPDDRRVVVADHHRGRASTSS